MKPVERDSPNDGEGLTWDDGKPLTKREGQAWWAGWEEGHTDGSADMQDVMRDEIERLREMLIEARDDATRFGRLMQKCVIALREVARCDFQEWARNALEKDADAQKQTLERIAQYDMQKLAINALKEWE